MCLCVHHVCCVYECESLERCQLSEFIRMAYDGEVLQSKLRWHREMSLERFIQVIQVCVRRCVHNTHKPTLGGIKPIASSLTADLGGGRVDASLTLNTNFRMLSAFLNSTRSRRGIEMKLEWKPLTHAHPQTRSGIYAECKTLSRVLSSF